MRRAEDVAQAVSLGVDALGFIFYDQSPRCVSVEYLKEIGLHCPPFVTLVAVFVNPEVSHVQQVIRELPIQYLQFHGDEPADFCEQFGRPYIKAISASSTAVIEQAMIDYSNAAAILLDTPSNTVRGGGGLIFDWAMIPKHPVPPLILAGGLNSDNVAQAIRSCAPYAVDVCSGVEEAAGIKSFERMRQFIEQVRGHNE
jgi:phosphoribosylanthranilate isomerase